jgi:putative addiction module CopG family antidote
MPDRVVTLPPDLDDFVLSSIESGRFESTQELVRAALIAFHRDQTAAQAKSVTPAIADGDAFRCLWEASAQSSFSLAR